MARKKRPEEVEEGAPAWVVSFGDMMSLLLTFFILIVSFSTLQESKFQKAMASVQRSMGVLPKNTSFSLFNRNRSEASETETQEVVEELMEMRAMISDENQTDQVKVTLTDKGAHFSIADPMLFASGSATLKSRTIPVLDMIGGFLKKFSTAEVIVEGHTDNVPISTAEFESNWELSAHRALAIVQYFIGRQQLGPERFGATGHGEFRPLSPNTTPENRARNRRVEIYANIPVQMNERRPEDAE